MSGKTFFPMPRHVSASWRRVAFSPEREEREEERGEGEEGERQREHMRQEVIKDTHMEGVEGERGRREEK